MNKRKEGKQNFFFFSFFFLFLCFGTILLNKSLRCTVDREICYIRVSSRYITAEKNLVINGELAVDA